MPITYVQRDTLSDVTDMRQLLTTTDTSVEVTFDVPPASSINVDYITDPDEPNKTSWESGTYTWEFRIITASAGRIVLDRIQIFRTDSAGVILETVADSGSGQAIATDTAGVLTGTLTGTAQTASPTDRLLLRFTLLNTHAHAGDSLGKGHNTTDDELLTPLVPPVQYIDVADSGVGSDTVTVEASVPVGDSGTGADAVEISIPIDVSDTGSGVESLTVEATVPVSDSGVGSESVEIQADVPISDSGTGFDTLSIEASLSVSDSGVGSDTVSVEIPPTEISLADSGTGADVVRIMKPATVQFMIETCSE